MRKLYLFLMLIYLLIVVGSAFAQKTTVRDNHGNFWWIYTQPSLQFYPPVNTFDNRPFYDFLNQTMQIQRFNQEQRLLQLEIEQMELLLQRQRSAENPARQILDASPILTPFPFITGQPEKMRGPAWAENVKPMVVSPETCRLCYSQDAFGLVNPK